MPKGKVTGRYARPRTGKAAAGMPKGKRKVHYGEFVHSEIVRLAAEGHTNNAIAGTIGVSHTTIGNWLNADSICPRLELIEDVERVREEALRMNIKKAELKLEDLCEGAEQIEEMYDDKGKLFRRVVKKLPPNMKALSYYLNNKAPKEWSEKQDIKVSGELNSNITINFNKE